MARPKQEVIRNIELKIRLSEEEYKEFEELAKELDLPVSNFARNLVLYAKTDAKFFAKIGLFKGIKKLQDWKIIEKQITEE